MVSASGSGSRYDSVSIYANTIHDCGGGGIKVHVGQIDNRGLDTHVWDNNIFNDGGDGIVGSYAQAPLIEGNTCAYLGRGKYPYTGGNFAGIWVLGCRDAVMRANVVHDTLMSVADSTAFDCDWGNEGNCTVEYNYSHDNAGGIFLNCDDCGTPGGARQIVRYNVFQNDCRMRSTGDDVTLEFYNNVVYCANKDFDIQIPPNTIFSNNIWVGRANSSLPASNSTKWESNLFQNTKEPVETAGITGDPNFVEPGTGEDTLESANGYQLKEGSLALGKGSVVPDNGGRDFWDIFWDQTPNIGAYNGPGV